MQQMKKGILAIAILGLISAFTVNELNWLTNMDEAKKASSESGKAILLSFSGSDWCANCMRLEKKLFESEAFSAFAAENLVLVNADFPARSKNKLSKEQTAHNEALAEKYNKAGKFPTVLVLDSKGEVKGKLQHPKETAAAYLTQLKSFVKE